MTSFIIFLDSAVATDSSLKIILKSPYLSRVCWKGTLNSLGLINRKSLLSYSSSRSLMLRSLQTLQITGYLSFWILMLHTQVLVQLLCKTITVKIALSSTLHVFSTKPRKIFRSTSRRINSRLGTPDIPLYHPGPSSTSSYFHICWKAKILQVDLFAGLSPSKTSRPRSPTTRADQMSQLTLSYVTLLLCT